MTVHDKKPAAPVGSGAPIARLRIREAALRHQAAQLQARAEHLQRVAHSQAQRLQRRVDAHEKIVLGSLVKKAGLDFPLPQHHKLTPHANDVQTTSIGQGLAAQSTAYDRELILGALLWLASALNRPENAVVSVPERQRLREDGYRALRNQSTTDLS